MEYVTHTVDFVIDGLGEIINDNITTTFIESLYGKNVLTFYEIGNTILDNTRCVNEQQNYLFNINAFNNYNNSLARNFCARQTMVNFIPAHNVSQQFVKILMYDEFGRQIPRYIVEAPNNVTMIDKLDYANNYVIYGATKVGSLIYNVGHLGIDFIGDRAVYLMNMYKNIPFFQHDKSEIVPNNNELTSNKEIVPVQKDNAIQFQQDNTTQFQKDVEQFHKDFIKFQQDNVVQVKQENVVEVKQETALEVRQDVVEVENGLISIDEITKMLLNSDIVKFIMKNTDLMGNITALYKMIKHHLTNSKQFMIECMKTINNIFNKNQEMRIQINAVLKLFQKAKIKVIDVYNTLVNFIKVNPILTIFANACNMIVHFERSIDIMKYMSLAMVSINYPIVGIIYSVCSSAYNFIKSFLDDDYTVKKHTMGLDFEVLVHKDYRFFSHNKYTARIVLSLFNIDISRTVKGNDKKAIDDALKQFELEFKVNAFVCTGLYYALYDKDNKLNHQDGLFNRIAFKIFIEKLIDYWVEVNHLSENEKRFYYAYCNQKSYDVNFLDILEYYFEKYIHQSSTIEYPTDEAKEKANYWDLHRDEDPFTFIYKLIYGEEPPYELSTDEKKNLDDFVKLIEKYNELRSNKETTMLELFQATEEMYLEGHEGSYTRWNVIKYYNLLLLKNDFSMGLIVNNAFTSIASMFSNSIIFMDERVKDNDECFLKRKINEFGAIYSQSYACRVLTMHISSTLGMMPFADKWTIEFFDDYFVPHIAIATGLGIGFMSSASSEAENTQERIYNSLVQSLKVNSYHITKSVYGIIKSAEHFICQHIVKYVDIITKWCNTVNNYFHFNILGYTLSLFTIYVTNKFIKSMIFENMKYQIEEQKLEEKKREHQINIMKYKHNLHEVVKNEFTDSYDKQMCKEQLDEIYYDEKLEYNPDLEYEPNLDYY